MQPTDDSYNDPTPAMTVKALPSGANTKVPPDFLRAVLDDRGRDYGDFTHMSRVAQGLKNVMNSGTSPLDFAKQEAVDMICTKMARLACGDPNKIDTWVDIAGYAKLIADLLKKEKQS